MSRPKKTWASEKHVVYSYVWSTAMFISGVLTGAGVVEDSMEKVVIGLAASMVSSMGLTGTVSAALYAGEEEEKT